MLSIQNPAVSPKLRGRFRLALFANPSFQFYPGDWQHDPALGACSAMARGVWIELLCQMHHGAPYGHLLINGQAPSLQMIARNARLEVREIRKGIGELEAAGVLRRTPEGMFYSTRMIRDEARRQEKKEAGKLGAEHGVKASDNPNASRPGERRLGGRPKQPPTEPPSTPDKATRQKPPPSSSTASSSSVSEENGKGAVAVDSIESFTEGTERKQLFDDVRRAFPDVRPAWVREIFAKHGLRLIAKQLRLFPERKDSARKPWPLFRASIEGDWDPPVTRQPDFRAV